MTSLAVSSGGDAFASSNTTKTRNRHSSGVSKTAINIETIRLHLSAVFARLQSRVSIDTLRPLPMFLGVSSNGRCVAVEAFTPPVRKLDKSTPEKIKSRVQLNFAFFLSNYVLMASMVALVVALMHPAMLFFLGITYSLWTFHSFLIRNELDLFGIHVHSLLSIQQRFYILFLFTVIVIISHCLLPTLFFLVISSLLILTHAFLRDPKHIEAMVDASSASTPTAGGGGSDQEGQQRLLHYGGNDDEERARSSNSRSSSSSSSGGLGSEVVLVERPTTMRAMERPSAAGKGRGDMI